MTAPRRGIIGLNWCNFLQQHDILYEMQSKVWQDGTALGNGSLGALAFEPFHLEWTINKNDVWDYRTPKCRRHSIADIRKMVAQGKDFISEMSNENLSGAGLYPCPKTCGQLRIRFGLDSIYAPGHRISKRLSLYDATLHTSLDKHLSHPRARSFICAEENVLVVSVRDVSAVTAFHNHVDLYRVPDAQMPPAKKGAKGDTIWLEQKFHDGFSYVLMARIVPSGGTAFRDFFRRTVQKKWWGAIEPTKEVSSRLDGGYAVAPVSGDFDVFVTVVTSKDSRTPLSAAKEKLEQAVRKGADNLHATHLRWWAGFWRKSYVGLGDHLLEQLWYVSLYHLATVLRGTPVGGLCGLWFGPMDTPSQILPWMGFYTNDYNAQLPVMPVFRANHPELADGSFRTLLAQLPQAKLNARELYGIEGAFYPLGTDPSGREIGSGPYRLIQTSGPYWSIFLWWHYLHTCDREYLKKVCYPIMREVAAFFTNYICWHPEENRYHLEISQQPELMYVKYDDPIDTLMMLKYALTATIEAARILKCDASLAAKCRHVLRHYPDYPRYENEFSPLRGLRPNHTNQVRTLAALFPCGEFDPEIAPEWSRLCKAEMIKMDFWSKTFGCNKGRLGGWTGIVHHIGIPACRLGWKDMAWNYLEDLLKTNVKPNGLISHNSAILADSRLSEMNISRIPDAELYHDLDPDPLKAVEILNGRLMECTTENLECRDTIFPALEGPAEYLLLMGEMLLQCQNGILRLFPSLPEPEDAEFHNLLVEGKSLVSASRKKGSVLFCRVKAQAPVRWKLVNPWPGRTVHMRSSHGNRQALKAEGRYWIFKLVRGEELVLAPRKQCLDFERIIRPRAGMTARARCKAFSDGMLVWLGKPKPSEYYASLEAARSGRRRTS